MKNVAFIGIDIPMVLGKLQEQPVGKYGMISPEINIMKAIKILCSLHRANKIREDFKKYT